MPHDALIFDLIGEFAPSAATRHRILVENAETLYGFPKSSSKRELNGFGLSGSVSYSLRAFDFTNARARKNDATASVTGPGPNSFRRTTRNREKQRNLKLRYYKRDHHNAHDGRIARGTTMRHDQHLNAATRDPTQQQTH